MKFLYLYSLPGEPSDTMRSLLDASSVPYSELRLDVDFRVHDVEIAGPIVLIEVNGRVHSEHGSATAALALFPSVSPDWTPTPVPLTEEEELIAKPTPLSAKDRDRVAQLTLKRLI